MKTKTTLLIIALALVCAVAGCAKNIEEAQGVGVNEQDNDSQKSGESFGIVKGSLLFARSRPERGTEVLASYPFGCALKLVAKSEQKETIDGVTDYWYKESTSGGWLFGGYLIRTEVPVLSRFSGQLIRCNYPCGGASCGYVFFANLVGEYYITSCALMDYPTSIPGAPDVPMYATVIGKYSMDTTKIEFNKVELIGYYGVKDEKWMANQNHGNQEKLLKSMPIKVYLHQQDSEGEYYASRMLDRIATRDRCTSGTRDPISEVYYVLKPAEITELQQMKGFMGKLRP